MNMIIEEDSETSIKTISPEEWMQQLEKIRISKMDMNKLIMNFFLIEGYKEAAENFQREAGIEISSCDLSFMQERIEIRSLIHQGEIDLAIRKVNELSPALFEENKEIYFNLLLQKLIEYIKKNEIETALEFAQNDLLPFLNTSSQNNEKDKKILDSLEKVMSLLAFEDISKSPLSALVENSQRIKISSELNSELLKNKSIEKESKLPTLLKLLLWEQAKLQEKLNFPVISNLASGEFQFKNVNK